MRRVASRKPQAARRFLIFLFLLALGALRPTALGLRLPLEAGVVIAIRVNQVGYLPEARKTAVACTLERRAITSFRVVDADNRTVFGPRAARAAGAFGPCVATYRLDFSGLRTAGTYRVVAGGAVSPPVRIAADAYRGVADSLLAYLREQRSGYNPVFRDSVHHRTDGVLVDPATLSGEFIPVSGGWADASDYLQYGATTAHATTMLLLAYRDHPGAFADGYQASGLPGANGVPDVLDEARWGLEWLLKMYPEDDLLLNQLGDDRDHGFWDLPVNDSSDYGWGRGGRRPVYPCTGSPRGPGRRTSWAPRTPACARPRPPARRTSTRRTTGRTTWSWRPPSCTRWRASRATSTPPSGTPRSSPSPRGWGRTPRGTISGIRGTTTATTRSGARGRTARGGSWPRTTGAASRRSRTGQTTAFWSGSPSSGARTT